MVGDQDLTTSNIYIRGQIEGLSSTLLLTLPLTLFPP